MWLGMIAILGLLVWGIYALVTSLNRKQSSDPAARILDERLARGEIDAAEYQHLKDVMTTARQSGSPSGTASR